MLNRFESDSSPSVHAPTKLAGVFCLRHPQDRAIGFCMNCEKAMCSSCQQTFPGDVSICAHCALTPLNRLPSGSKTKKVRQILPLTMCANHPNSSAVIECSGCKQGVCVTCEFQLPTGISLCPVCITNSERTISTKRKVYLLLATILGCLSWAFIIGVTILNATERVDTEASGLVFTASLLLTTVGTALAFSAIDRRLYTPTWAWLPACLNGLTVLLIVVLSIVGAFA